MFPQFPSSKISLVWLAQPASSVETQLLVQPAWSLVRINGSVTTVARMMASFQSYINSNLQTHKCLCFCILTPAQTTKKLQPWIQAQKSVYDVMYASSLITLYSPCMFKVSLPCQPPLPWVLWLAHRACLLPPAFWAPQCLLPLPAPHSDRFLPLTPVSSAGPRGWRGHIQVSRPSPHLTKTCALIFQPSERTKLQLLSESKTVGHFWMAADQLAGNGQVVTTVKSKYVVFCPCLAFEQAGVFSRSEWTCKWLEMNINCLASFSLSGSVGEDEQCFCLCGSRSWGQHLHQLLGPK